MIKKYNFENLIFDKDNLKCVSLVDELFDNNLWCKDSPHYQTFPDLFEYPGFFKLKYSFLLSCFSYLECEVTILNIKSWCYCSDCSTQSNQDRESHWHSHGTEDCKKLSGIFYLHNPKDILDYESSGTEFKDYPNIIPEDFSWFIYPSHLLHRPGKIQSNHKRYVVAADFTFDVP